MPNREDTIQARAVLPPTVRVLAVEDDAGMRRRIARVLQEHGFRVTGARNGFERWGALGPLPTDLIRLDITLPGPTAIDLCRTARQEPHSDHHRDGSRI